MSAHRPIAHRAFSVLIAVLLIGGLVAPIGAAQPAAAQESTTEEICSSPARFFQTTNHACTTSEMLGTVDDTESGAYLQSDIHANARGVKESWDSTFVLTGNYLEDTPTIASLEGKNAIANSWENGVSQSNASDEVNESINQYYTNLEIQILEETSAHAAQLDYLSQQAVRDSDTDDRFIVPEPWETDNSGTYIGESGNFTDTANLSYTLANGTTHDYVAPEVRFQYDASSSGSATEVVTALSPDGEWTTYNNSAVEFEETYSGSDDGPFRTEGRFYVANVPDFNLSSAKVYDFAQPWERMNEIEQQRQTALDNFDPQFINDMYTALDNGEIAPEDLRSAEGMVRHLSGDSEVTDQRYKLATHAVLDLERPDLNMSMTVQYDGATGYETTIENGTRIRNYTDQVSQTYEGLVFSGETPTDGFQTGETYDTSALNGSQLIVTDNETVHFYSGNMTVESMQDSDGNEVNQTDWEPGPNYDTYSSDEYVALLETISEQQQQIAEQEEEEGGGPLFGGLFDGGLGGGGTLVGLAIIGVVVLVVVGFVMDMIPGMGN